MSYTGGCGSTVLTLSGTQASLQMAVHVDCIRRFFQKVYYVIVILLAAGLSGIHQAEARLLIQ